MSGSRSVTLTGGQALVRVLKACRVQNVFGLVGGAFTPFLAALANDNAMRFVGVRHEAAGAWMATAEFYATGSIAVCIGEQGPGGLNMLSGIGTAFNNNLALLAITTNVPSIDAYPHRGRLMDADHKRLFEGLTKWNAVVGDARRIPSLVRTAVRKALTGCPGPVHLDFPGDVLVDKLEYDVQDLDAPLEHFMPSGRSQADHDAVARAADLLLSAERPLVVAGGGTNHSMAQASLLKLVDFLQAPATSTMTGLGAVPSDHASFIGHGGVIGGPTLMRALREADVVVAVGCRFSSYLWDGSQQAILGWPTQRLIQIDSDPTRFGDARALDLGLLGDARAVLDQLIKALAKKGKPRPALPWLKELREDFEHYFSVLSNLGDGATEPIHPAVLARAIGEFTGSDGLVVFDGGHTCFWSNALTPAVKPRTRFNDAAMAHLGFGAPFAHALKLLHPHATVLNITGDGSFGFTLQELDTARRYRLPVIHVIHNNQSWGIIKAGQSRAGFDLGSDLSGTDYAAVAHAFGCHGERVTIAEEIIPALRRAQDSNLPAVVDVMVSFVPHPQLPAFGKMGLAAAKDGPAVH